MQAQIKKIKKRFDILKELVADPALFQQPKTYAKLQKEYHELEEILDLDKRKKEVEEAIKVTRKVLEDEGEDEEMRQLAKEELQELEVKEKDFLQQVKELLLPKDPNDSKNSILEIRAGTGGGEAAIWVGDLFRMYQKLAEQKGWKLQVLDYGEGAAGGYKEIISRVVGEKVYAMLKYESGVHRVQRVPETETQGRIHTSAASVVVLPEVDEVQVHIDKKDIRKDTFCSSGPGGQSVNTTYSAIRLTHIPTGIVVSCQDEKSQLKNLEKALKVMRSRLYDRAQKEQQEEVGATRKSIIGGGDRSEKIRTYNYPQSRVTDHRINYSQHNLTHVLDGNLTSFIQALRVADRSARLAAAQDQPKN